MTTMQPYRGRSLFWPLIFIGVGLIWLLANLNILQASSIAVLFRLWPLVLIIIGLDLLFGRNNPQLGLLIGVGGVALIIILMLLGPSLGIVQSAEVKEDSYTAPVAGATSANVNLSLSVADTTIKALPDSTDLIQANLRYIGDIRFDVAGTTDKTVTLKNINDNFGNNFWDFGIFNDSSNLRWDIGLAKNVPIALNITGGVGSNHIDLSDVNLTDLRASGGVGSVDLALPTTENPYNVDMSIGTGSANIRIEKGAAVDFTLHGGVGSVTIDVPDDAAVRVEAKTGVGSVSVPGGYNRISGNENNFVGEDGVWETSGFDGANRQIVIHYDGGVGSLSIN